MKELNENVITEIIIEANNLFSDRNKTYGNAFEKHGVIVKQFFPDGIELKTDEDFKRFGLFESIVGKLNRYASNFNEGHDDSILDASVYCHMLNYVDRKAKSGD